MIIFILSSLLCGIEMNILKKTCDEKLFLSIVKIVSF